MAAYPMTYVSRVSQPTPDAGIRTEMADDSTPKFRRDQSVVQYGIRIIHELLTEAERDAIFAFIVAHGYAGHTFTLHGIDYVGTLTNEPKQIDRKGSLYTLEANFIAVKA